MITVVIIYLQINIGGPCRPTVSPTTMLAVSMCTRLAPWTATMCVTPAVSARPFP